MEDKGYDVSVSSTYQVEIMDKFKPNYGVLSWFPVKDFDFDIVKRQIRKEVVNLLDNRAVRFDNQNLRDYLLNYIFYQEKRITPSEIIDLAFPEYRTRIVFESNEYRV